MIAYRRADIRDLNEAAHALMLRAGRLGHETCMLGEREFRVGDRVLCRQNDPRLGLRNGTRATIVGLDPRTLTLRTDTGRPPLDRRSRTRAKHLDHGYALTGHAAQGATVDRAFVLLAGRGALQEWGYVACSRARTETRLYLSDTACEREMHASEQSSLDLSDRATRALTTPASEPLAVDQAQPQLDPTALLAARQHERLEVLRLQAEQRLVVAEQALRDLGKRGRGRRASKCQAEIAFQQTVLRLVDEKRDGLTPPPAAESSARPHRERHQQFVRTRSPESPLDRNPPGVALDR